MAIARQWHGKHISMATYAPATIEEPWEAVAIGYITRTNGTNYISTRFQSSCKTPRVVRQ
jgi:hypothetical protein